MFAPPEIRPQPPILARADLGIVLLLTLFTFVVRGAWFGDPNADLDEQLYSLIGHAMLHGAVPFVDLWDRKPYGLFAIFAFAHAIGGPGPAAYQVLAASFTAAGAIMTYALARAQVDRITAAGAGLLYVVLLAIDSVTSGNSEAFFVPMMLAMALLVLDPAHPRAVPRALAAMLIGGAALQVKYTMLPQCLFFGCWALWGQYQRGMPLPRLAGLAGAFALLGLLPTGLVAAGYALAGAWDAFVFANFLSFFDRLPANEGRLPQPILVFLGLHAALALLGINAARRESAGRLPPTYGFVLLWMAAALASTFLPSTVYRYYLAALVPPTVLLALPLVARRAPGARINLPALAPAVLYLLIVPFQYAASHENRAATARLAAAIAPHLDARAGRCLLVFDGPTALYRLTGSCLPGRFVYPDHLDNALESEALGVRQEAEVARILARRPPVIVTADTPLTPQNPATKGLIDEAIARDYRLLTQEELHHRRIAAWVRRD